MKTTAPLILASGSPRRKELLTNLGLPFEVVVRPIDETIPAEVELDEMDPAGWLAEKKTESYVDLKDENIILTADTLVYLHGVVMGKPKDEEEAIEMLRKLSGNEHEVVTGVCIRHKDRMNSFSEVTLVNFKELNEDEINYYVKKYKPFDKAGAYGIQEWIGMIGITQIDGDFYNVMGLPVAALWSELKILGYLVD